MGDVFDAMNRAKSQREGGAPGPAGVPVPTADSEQAALPLDEVAEQAAVSAKAEQASGLRLEEAPARIEAPAPARSRGVAAAAADKARENGATDHPTLLPNPSKLNGYAPEVVVHHDRGSLVTEQYRAIRTQILARARNRRVQTHVFTSSGPEEGKSLTVINLGMTFAELRNHKTLLIEADLRQPSFGKIFTRECHTGMIPLLRGEVTEIDKVIQHTVYDNLDYIPAGGRDGVHSTELLSSPRMAQILDRLKDRYDHIFIDTPPVVTVTDPCILGALADQVILVVRLHRTPQDIVDRAKRLLRAANCEVSGVILTHMQQDRKGYPYRYAYGYGKYIKSEATLASKK